MEAEYALEQAGRAHARRPGGWALGVVIASVMGVERRARNDLGVIWRAARADHGSESDTLKRDYSHADSCRRSVLVWCEVVVTHRQGEAQRIGG